MLHRKPSLASNGISVSSTPPIAKSGAETDASVPNASIIWWMPGRFATWITTLSRSLNEATIRFSARSSTTNGPVANSRRLCPIVARLCCRSSVAAWYERDRRLGSAAPRCAAVRPSCRPPPCATRWIACSVRAPSRPRLCRIWIDCGPRWFNDANRSESTFAGFEPTIDLNWPVVTPRMSANCLSCGLPVRTSLLISVAMVAKALPAATPSAPALLNAPEMPINWVSEIPSNLPIGWIAWAKLVTPVADTPSCWVTSFTALA